ncbi:MAG: tetratricopeptide repeat protein [Planctomycetales bacterium]|nr:tetratricopeptide repeat protein [Planctomycetales bacterium]
MRETSSKGPYGTDSRAVLADFGLAKSVATGSRLTRTGEALGTPAYMSPEQARGEASSLTPATDVWGLACVLLEMLSGRPPYDGVTPAAVVGAILLREPPRVRSLLPDAPPGLDRVVRVALTKRAGDRYAEAGAFRDDLERLLRGERPWARPAGTRRRVASVAALSLAAAVAGALLLRAASGPGRPDPGPSRPGPGPEDLAARARAVRGSDAREAARLLAEALRAEPGRHDWRLERGLALWIAGGGAEALEEWRQIPPEAPEAARARIYGGLEAFCRLDMRDARRLLEPLAASGSADARLARGILAAGKQAWAEARESLRGLPGWEAALVRGYVEGGTPGGDPGLAVRELDRALREGIPLAWAYSNRASDRMELGDLAGALEDCEHALRLAPQDPRVLANRGAARQRQGDLRGAIADFDRALVRDPSLAEAWTDRAMARRTLGDARGAIADADAALALRPETPQALLARANARADLGDHAGALADYDALIRLQPTNPDALHGRATVHYDLGNLEQALGDESAAIAARPEDPEFRFSRGNIHLALGDLRAAVAGYDEALRFEPASARFLGMRGAARRELGDLAGALADLDQALRASPEHPESLNNRAVARYASGDWKGAVEDLRQALKARPAYPEALQNLGEVLHARQEWAAAVPVLEDFLRHSPEDPAAPKLRRLLEECRRNLPDGRGAGR